MQSDVFKAQRATIEIGDISLEVAMLPDGSYRLSYTQATEVINKDRSSLFRFCRSKRFKTLLGKESERYSFTEEIFIEGANRPITPIKLEVACLYWQKCAAEGNSRARALVVALLKRSLYDLADEAFKANRTDHKYQHMLLEDLSDDGVDRIEAMHQSLDDQSFASQAETEADLPMLKLKVRLVELELELEQLQQRKSKNSFPASDINKVGAAPWRVIPWMQKTLGWSDAAAASSLLCQLGFGFKSKHWFKVNIAGDLWVMPLTSFDSLRTVVEKYKSDPR